MVDEQKHRPYTTVVLAMSADGKIADVKRSPARFSSPIDKIHLEQQIAASNAVLFGAGTLRAYGTTVRVSHPQLLEQRKQCSLPPQPVQILASLQANIDPQLRFFHQPVPRWLLTTSVGAKHWQERPEFEKIIVCQTTISNEERGAEEAGGAGGVGEAGEAQGEILIQNLKSKIQNSPHLSIDWVVALQQLADLGVKRLAVLGGGQLVASMLAADLIDEFWLTVCPLVLGGASSPTPVEGIGFDAALAPRLELVSVQAKEQEVFLHYRLQRQQRED
jgi:riboflavin biosynthesis pyrimidine reductase